MSSYWNFIITQCIKQIIKGTRLSTILLLTSISLLTACGGGGSDGGNSNEGEATFPSRENNPDIPIEHTGQTQKNTRFYAANTTGYKVTINTTGLIGNTTLSLGQEQLTITDNGSTSFATTFVANTVVTSNIESQPFLQVCSFAGGINTGTIQSDSPLILTLNCVDDTAPATPFIKHIISETVDSLTLEWEHAIDRDTPAANIAYNVYWSTNQIEVQNKTAAMLALPAGTLTTQLTSLTASTRYYIAVEAVDNDANVSAISTIRQLTTIATPNVLTGNPFYTINSNDISITGTTWTIPTTAFTATPQVGEVLISDLGSSHEIVKIVSSTLNGTSYDIVVEAGNAGDVFQTLNLSTDMALQITDPSDQPSPTNPVFAAALVITPGICRSTTTKLTDEQLSQIYIKPIRKFTPRVINNLKLDLSNPFNPNLTGNVEFVGDMTVGVQVGFEITDKIADEYTCDLIGFPIESPALRYAIFGFPIVQHIAVDVQLKLNLEAELNMQGNAQTTATASLSAKLLHNPDSGLWENSATPSLNYTTENSLTYGARLNTRAAILPKLSTTFNYVATVSLTANAGADARVSINHVGEDDPVRTFRTLPFILKDFSSDADVKLSMAANLSFLGYELLDYPDREIYTSPKLRIFDTPSVCTNEATDRDSCETHKKISKTGEQNRFDLAIYLLDGANNPADLASIHWQVSPDNGFIAVDPMDPRKAVLETYDDNNYSVVASANGKLGGVARKFARFSVGQGCQYGLGHDLVEGNDYLIGGDGSYPTLYHPGYLFPEGLDTGNTENDFHETCVHEDAIEEDVDNIRYRQTRSIVSDFYSGQRNGKTIEKQSNYENDVLIDTSIYVYNYINGIVNNRNYTYFSVDGGNASYIEYFFQYKKFTDAATGIRYIVETYEKGYAMGASGNKYLRSEGFHEINNLNMTSRDKVYYPNGVLESILISKSTLDLSDLPNISSGNDGEPTIGRIEPILVTSTRYYPNGKRDIHYDYNTDVLTSCYWYDNEGIGRRYESPTRQPGDVYGCETSQVY